VPGQQTDSNRIHVAVIGEGPQGKRVPGVDEDPLSRQPGKGQQLQQADDADGLEAEHDQPNARDVVRDPAGHCEHDLREGRIDRPRVARAVDLRVDNWIAQERQCGVRRNVSVRIDTCRLHAAVPDVAINVGRQDRRRGQQKQAERDCDANHNPHRATWPRVAQDKVDGSKIDDCGDHQQPQQHSYTKNVHSARGRRHIDQQTGPCQGQQRCSKPDQPTQRLSCCHMVHWERVNLAYPVDADTHQG